MVLKLYMHIMSPPSRAVLMLATDLGLDFEIIETGVLTGANMTEEYLKKNPQHTIPLLEDDDFILWDSHAILAYLVSVYGKSSDLYPTDPKKRAKVDQRLHFEGSVVFVRLSKFARGTFFTGPVKVTDEQRAEISEVYDFFEAFLGEDAWAAGDTKTIADYSLLSSISNLHEWFPISNQKYPRITAWLSKGMQLPFYEKTNGVGVKAFAELIKSKIID